MPLSKDRITKSIISLSIDLISYKEAITEILILCKNKKSGYVCFVNAHMSIEAYLDKLFADQVNNATFVLSDGMSLVKALKLIHGIKQDRIAGMDVMPDLIRLSAQNQLKIFFFGTTPEVLEIIRLKVLRNFPNANIVGLLAPPFNKIIDDDSFINSINSSGANLVFVALGCPKQEKWMAQHSHKINAVLLGVGGAFPVFAELSKRAPLFMQKIGFEWLYRLFQEPHRLFKRYLITNSLFIYLVLRDKMKNVFR